MVSGGLRCQNRNAMQKTLGIGPNIAVGHGAQTTPSRQSLPKTCQYIKNEMHDMHGVYIGFMVWEWFQVDSGGNQNRPKAVE